MLSQLVRVRQLCTACSDASLVEIPTMHTISTPDELPDDLADLMSPANQVGTVLRCGKQHACRGHQVSATAGEADALFSHGS
jgi:hypothetical protein